MCGGPIRKNKEAELRRATYNLDQPWGEGILRWFTRHHNDTRERITQNNNLSCAIVPASAMAKGMQDNNTFF